MLACRLRGQDPDHLGQLVGKHILLHVLHCPGRHSILEQWRAVVGLCIAETLKRQATVHGSLKVVHGILANAPGYAGLLQDLRDGGPSKRSVSRVESVVWISIG